MDNKKNALDKKWITYWKKSLSDSMKANIEVGNSPFEIENFTIHQSEIQDIQRVNQLIDEEEKRINQNKKKENWIQLNEITILIAPFKLRLLPENLIYYKDKAPKYPFWYHAKINRKGILSVPEECFPIFQRKYLEPLADERTEFIFSSVEKVDQSAVVGKEELNTYEEYIQYLQKVFQTSIGQELRKYQIEEYETIDNGTLVIAEEEMNAAASILELYEKILKETKPLPLLSDFTKINNSEEVLPVAVPELMEMNPLHLGQMGAAFPLSISQRKSLYTQLQTQDKVFAVNGPPGTGKTTLLQSMVANTWAEYAIKGGEPPIILACSTNNQAVTNIIDSFSKSDTKEGNLQGRWIPDFDGYATYLPSGGKKEEELKGINYKKLNQEGIFSRIENEDFLGTAKEYFVEKAKKYFNRKYTIPEITTKLRKEIIGLADSLKEATQLWQEYKNAENLFFQLYKNKDTENYFSGSLLREETLERDLQLIADAEQKIIEYFRKESLWRKLLCFFNIQSAVKERKARVTILLRECVVDTDSVNLSRQSDILTALNTTIEKIKSIGKKIKNWKAWKNKQGITGTPPADEEAYWDYEYEKIHTQTGPNCFYDELDVNLRHRIFQLTLHYWEARWIAQLEIDLNDPNFDKKGEEAVKNRWRRQAMLTPCFVSTFYMAPKFFSYYKFLHKEAGKNIFDTPPLFNFIDLLIVDEAGQVSPEVGTATFSLAKKAVVVGDVKQIEPVWNVTGKMDVGNLKKTGLITGYTDTIYEKSYDPKGFLASTGSIMKMAQTACGYKEEGMEEKGVILTEHRRCYDEIINYCNVLAYNGQLKPLKGKASGLLFPPMYGVHVEGNSTVHNKSRFNEQEATAIADWLRENKVRIEEKYKNKYGRLEDIVGIITPFTGQKNLLKSVIKKAGFDTSALTIGTVHALQGAEREIILFSMVYGEGDSSTLFFDRGNKPNMMNVAVSRAKENFIVFANTHILDKKSKTPSGILANFLEYNN